jgi:hypothetical protein
MLLIIAACRSFYSGTIFDPRHSTYFRRFIGLTLLCTATDATAIGFSDFWKFVGFYLQRNFWTYIHDYNQVFNAIWPSLKALFILEACFGYAYFLDLAIMTRHRLTPGRICLCLCFLDDIWALVQLIRARNRRKRYLKEEIELSDMPLD